MKSSTIQHPVRSFGHTIGRSWVLALGQTPNHVLLSPSKGSCPANWSRAAAASNCEALIDKSMNHSPFKTARSIANGTPTVMDSTAKMVAKLACIRVV